MTKLIFTLGLMVGQGVTAGGSFQRLNSHLGSSSRLHYLSHAARGISSLLFFTSSCFSISLLFPCTEFLFILAAAVHKNRLWCISKCTWGFSPAQAFTGKICLVSLVFQGSSVLPFTTCWGLFYKRNSWGRDGKGKFLKTKKKLSFGFRSYE